MSVLLNRAKGRNMIMYSTEGGMDIEEVAEHTPHLIFTEEIDQQVVVEKKEADSQNDISDEVLENKFQLVRLRPSSLERIAHILQDAGYKAKISGDENFRFIISGADGWNFKITFHDDAPAGIETRQVSFQFSSGSERKYLLQACKNNSLCAGQVAQAVWVQ
jgi:hypothetical protein